MNNLITIARAIPAPEAALAMSLSPVRLDAPGRGAPLEMRITAPMTGDNLPIILLSHGHGPSLYLPSKDGYAPLANFYAERGFAVIQPTHANSKIAGLGADAPGAPLFARSRVEDMKRILDGLTEIEAMIPALAGRLDHTRVAAVGHSLGGQTVGLLLGALITDTAIPDMVNLSLFEPRVKAGVLLAAPGNGGDSLSEYARTHYTSLNPDYTTLKTPMLVVVGDSDESQHLTGRGPAWHADAYHDAPGATALLTLHGGKHGLGGVAGYDARETDDEDPDRLAITQRASWAYLRSALYPGDPAWARAVAALAEHAGALAHVDSK